MIQRGDKKITSVPMRQSACECETSQSVAERQLQNKTEKASGVYDHMPTALYTRSDVSSLNTREKKQDVQPDYRTA